jgi:hypothetical protein
MNTVPSGRFDFCMNGAFAVFGTCIVGTPTPAILGAPVITNADPVTEGVEVTPSTVVGGSDVVVSSDVLVVFVVFAVGVVDVLSSCVFCALVSFVVPSVVCSVVLEGVDVVVSPRVSAVERSGTFLVFICAEVDATIRHNTMRMERRGKRRKRPLADLDDDDGIVGLWKGADD